MKVLGICGSPREGNSEKVLNEILKRVQVQSEVDRVLLSQSHLEYCDGCMVCEQTKVCTIKDDMQCIREKMISADTIVLVTPVYWDDVPAILKNMIDRTNPFSRQLGGKNIYIIVCGMADDVSWNAAISILKNYSAIVGMNCIGADSFYAKNCNDVSVDTINRIAENVLCSLKLEEEK